MGASQAQTDLVLAMDEGHELSGSIEFAAELFLPATAEQMARHLEVSTITTHNGHIFTLLNCHMDGPQHAPG